MGGNEVIYGRLFSTSGTPLSDSFIVSKHWENSPLNPNIVNSENGEGFSVAYITRYPKELYVDHYNLSPSGTITFEGSDSGLFPAGI